MRCTLWQVHFHLVADRAAKPEVKKVYNRLKKSFKGALMPATAAACITGKSSVLRQKRVVCD